MKTLIIQTAFLGDAVLTLPLIQSFKRESKSDVRVLCIPQTKEAFLGNPGVDGVITFDKKGKEKGVLNLLKLCAALRKEKFDTVIVPHPSFQSALIAYLSGCKRRVGFSSNPGRILFTVKVKTDKNKHQIERYLDILAALGFKPKSEEPVVPADSASEKWAADMLGGADFYVGINPGSAWPTKRWLPERFAAAADKIILKYGGRAVIVGGAGDAAAAAAVERAMSSHPLNLAGKTNLKQLTALIKRCKIFVTNDSGPMHIAAACGVPTVAVFGPTVREFGFYPHSKNSIVVEKNIKCRPCGKHGPKICPNGTFECMNNISAEEVAAAADKLLNAACAAPKPAAKAENR